MKYHNIRRTAHATAVIIHLIAMVVALGLFFAAKELDVLLWALLFFVLNGLFALWHVHEGDL